MADGEADPFCVALAGALGGGLVSGMDSDFAVLCVEGYGGYIPIDELVWQSDEPALTQTNNKDDDGFTAVVTKPRTKRKSSGLIPPSGSPPELSLHATIYHPHTLAAHLRLPPALLPLFSALVGNDFSNPQHSRKFFERQSTSIQRIWKVAQTISATIKQSPSRPQGRGDAVLDVIHTAISQLLVRPDLIASGEMDKIVDETVEAALECTIPSTNSLYTPSGACALHPRDECPLVSALGDDSAALVQAYRAGRLHPRLLSAATAGIVLPKMFLEDPERKSCAAVANNIWTWIWAVLVSGGHVSLPSPKDGGDIVKSIGDDGTDSRAEDDSELISVAEDFTATEPSVNSEDLASELKERLKGLAGDWDEDTTEGQKDEDSKLLMQYERRGLKFVPEPIALRTLSDLSPGHSLSGRAEQWTRKARIVAFLEGTKSNTRALQDAFESVSMDLGMLVWVCVLRCTIQSSAELAPSGNGGGSAAVVGRWRKAEARGFIGSLESNSSSSSDSTPPLDTRTIQRVAQLLYAFDAGARLTEALYLFEGSSGMREEAELDGEDIVGRAVRMFNGRAVHAAAAASYLAQVDGRVWDLVCDGLEEDVWAHEPEKGKAKSKIKSKAKGRNEDGAKSSSARGAHGFNVLASLENE
jgi:hypothetical protein